MQTDKDTPCQIQPRGYSAEHLLDTAGGDPGRCSSQCKHPGGFWSNMLYYCTSYATKYRRVVITAIADVGHLQGTQAALTPNCEAILLKDGKVTLEHLFLK